VVAGTPPYMAPEQARGEAVDHRADLFSLGSVLYACCTGAPPFRGGTALAVLRQVSDRAPVPVREQNPEVPAWLETLITRLLAKDPAQRFQSAAEVATLLEGYLAHLRQPASVAAPTLPSTPPAGDTGKPRVRPGRALRKWLLALAGMGGVLGLLGALGASLIGSNEPKSLEPKDGLVCLLVNKNSGRCLSIAGGSDTPGARVVQGPTPGQAGAAERWALIGTGEAFRLRNEKTHLVLEIGSANTDPGVQAIQWRDQFTKKNQHWTFEPVGDAYLLRPGHCDLVLAVGESSQDEGAAVIQWDYIPDVTDQLWELWPPTPPGGAGDQKQTAVPAAPRPLAGAKAGLAAARLFGLGLLIVLGVCVYARRRRRAAAGRTAAAANLPAESVPATAPVSFPCSACGKNLRAATKLAGRKVKCPHCGKVAVVPGISSTPPPAPPTGGVHEQKGV
jgi:DNA-directed RNA polymerase subunit RPC12/RpoP